MEEWKVRLEKISKRLRKAESLSEYLMLLLASVDEINKIQEERGLEGENWKIKSHWFPTGTVVHAYKFYELLRNLHLIRLQELVPTATQVIKWIENKEIIF